MGDEQEEFRALVGAVRALVEWEEEISGTGWPSVDLAPLAARAVATSQGKPAGPDSVSEPDSVSVSAPDSVSVSAPDSVSVSAADSATAPDSVSAPDSDSGSRPEGRSVTVSARDQALSPDAQMSSPSDALPSARRLRLLQEAAAKCSECRLHEGRTKSVFARGSFDTDLVFVGEGPGYHEDQQGLPFVGRAGQLLDRMIKAMGYDRDGVYICNVVKCRPPNNRTPKPDEAGACARYLEGQLEVVKPKVIVALGRCATENLGCVEPGARGWRGRWSEYQGIPVMPTYHPAFLLRSPEFKRPVWEDLQKVMRKLGREVA